MTLTTPNLRRPTALAVAPPEQESAPSSRHAPDASREIDVVDLGSEESFPASDPPAWMGSSSIASSSQAEDGRRP